MRDRAATVNAISPMCRLPSVKMARMEDAARRATTELLERMTEADWSREGTHTEHGRYTAERWLDIYSKHAHNHAEQIRLARAAGRKKEA